MRRVNIYAEELPEERAIEIVRKKADTGRTFFGVRIFLKSAKELHDALDDDDRSAITFWGPRADVAELLRRAAVALEVSAADGRGEASRLA